MTDELFTGKAPFGHQGYNHRKNPTPIFVVFIFDPILTRTGRRSRHDFLQPDAKKKSQHALVATGLQMIVNCSFFAEINGNFMG